VTLAANIAGDDVVNIAEKAAGFTLSGTTQAGAAVTLTVGASGSLTATVNGTDWSFAVPADAAYIAGTSVDVTAMATLSGHVDGTATRALTVDLAAPTVTLALADGVTEPARGTFDVVATVTGAASDAALDADDFMVTNATVTVAAASPQTDPPSWVATVTPDANFEGAVTVRVNADAVMDAAGNANAASDELPVDADLVVPTVTLGRFGTPPDTFTATGAFGITITFSEAVTGFAADDIAVGNGTVKAGSLDDANAPVYAATIVPDDDFEGMVTVDVAADVADDAAGNANTAATQLSVTADLVAPTVMIVRADA